MLSSLFLISFSRLLSWLDIAARSIWSSALKRIHITWNVQVVIVRTQCLASLRVAVFCLFGTVAIGGDDFINVCIT